MWTLPSSRYERIWRCGCGVSLLPYVLVSFILAPIAVVLVLLAGPAVFYLVSRCEDTDVGWGAGVRWTGIALVCLVVMATMDLGVVWWLALAGTTSPRVLRAVVRHSQLARGVRRPRRRRGRATGGLLADQCLAEMSDQQLCRAWSASFVRLKNADSPQRQQREACVRCALLNELERRDAGGLARWLDSHPPPAADIDWLSRGHRPPEAV